MNPDNAKLCQQCGSLLFPPSTEQGAGISTPTDVPEKTGMTGTQKEVIIVGVLLFIVVIIGVFALTSYAPSSTTSPPTPPPPTPTMTFVHGMVYGENPVSSQTAPYQIVFVDLDSNAEYVAKTTGYRGYSITYGNYSISLKTGALFAAYCDIQGYQPYSALESPFSPSGSIEVQDFTC